MTKTSLRIVVKKILTEYHIVPGHIDSLEPIHFLEVGQLARNLMFFSSKERNEFLEDPVIAWWD